MGLRIVDLLSCSSIFMFMMELNVGIAFSLFGCKMLWYLWAQMFQRIMHCCVCVCVCNETEVYNHNSDPSATHPVQTCALKQHPSKNKPCVHKVGAAVDAFTLFPLNYYVTARHQWACHGHEPRCAARTFTSVSNNTWTKQREWRRHKYCPFREAPTLTLIHAAGRPTCPQTNTAAERLDTQ